MIMKKNLFLLLIFATFAACENKEAVVINTGDTSNDTISATMDIIGMWEICNFVNYTNANEIDIIDTIPISKNGKYLLFEGINETESIVLTLKYANILSTYCNVGKSDSINIRNEWGGTELLDATGFEDKLITLLNVVDLWVITNKYLYLIDSESQFNYNALCLGKVDITQFNDSAMETHRAPIDSSECYMLQEWNELGEPVKSYGCMRFDHNAGSTFAAAYAGIKSEIESLANQYINDEIKSGNSNADKWELRQVIRNVTNSPNDKLIYTSIELYMYSSIWGAYTIVNQYCVIDSEGNIYNVITPDD